VSRSLQASVPPEARLAEAPARGVLADYVTLTKPRIMLLILITAFGAMCFAAGGWPGAGLVATTMVGLGLSSAGASALNHLLDRDIDALMTRTAERPVASGRVSPDAAAGFGAGLIAASVAVLWIGVNAMTAALALAGALFYVVVYTAWLKRRTPQNIVIGGAAGAVPPLVGWAAVTGDVGLPAVYMFALIFLWTPPHFWALAILAKADYARARVPMLPVVRGDAATARQILAYTAVLGVASVVPVLDGTFGLVYLAAALPLGGTFVWLAARLVRTPGRAPARHVFLYSLAYLALLFAAIGVDQVQLTS
jgi:protoheme IX farnesyltransferase